MDKDAQQQLNSKLADAADNGNIADVSTLIAAGADVNGMHCLDGCRHTPLMKAAVKGNLAVMTLLLDCGADTAMTASEGKTAAELARDAGKKEAVTHITSFQEQGRPDRVVFTSSLGNRTREDIYDFTMNERVTLIRNGRFGEVESAVITGFSSVEDTSDTSALRKAFNEHLRRGGTRDEAAIFGRGTIAKPRPGLTRNF